MDEAAAEKLKVFSQRDKYANLPNTPLYQRDNGMQSVRTNGESVV